MKNKNEAIKTLESVIVDKKYDASIRGFVSMYHSGGIHRLVNERGMKISEIVAMAETKVTLPSEVKEALSIIFA